MDLKGNKKQQDKRKNKIEGKSQKPFMENVLNTWSWLDVRVGDWTCCSIFSFLVKWKVKRKNKIQIFSCVRQSANLPWKMTLKLFSIYLTFNNNNKNPQSFCLNIVFWTNLKKKKNWTSEMRCIKQLRLRGGHDRWFYAWHKGYMNWWMERWMEEWREVDKDDKWTEDECCSLSHTERIPDCQTSAMTTNTG